MIVIMQTKTQNSLSKKQFIIGLVIILIVGMVAAGIFTASASQSSTQSIRIEPENNGNTYTAELDNQINGATTWKYTIRDDATCDSSVFSSDSDNLIDVVYSSNSYTPADKDELVEFNNKYICFSAANAFSNSSGWYASKQLVWFEVGVTSGLQNVYTPVNSYDGSPIDYTGYRAFEHFGCDIKTDALLANGFCIPKPELCDPETQFLMSGGTCVEKSDVLEPVEVPSGAGDD